MLLLAPIRRCPYVEVVSRIPRPLKPRQIVIAEQIEEVIAFLNEAVALLNEAITASPVRQVEIRMEFDRIIRKIDEIRLSNLN